MENSITCCVVVRNRTLRRQQKSIILKDLSKDVDTVNELYDNAEQLKDKDLMVAYSNLQSIVYASYCDVLNSEV